MGVETFVINHRFRIAPWMKGNARTLRREMTDAERALWHRLRRRQIGGWKFRRQHPLGAYIADFVCLEARLIVEVDGGQHAERRQDDRQRTDWLERQGYRVLRLWNNEVLTNIEGVTERIARAVQKGVPPPS